MVKTFIATPVANFRFHLLRAGEVLGSISIDVDGVRIKTRQWDEKGQIHQTEQRKRAGFIVGKATEVTVDTRRIDEDHTEVKIAASGVSITAVT